MTLNLTKPIEAPADTNLQRLVVVRNKVATNAKEADNYIADLTFYGGFRNFGGLKNYIEVTTELDPNHTAEKLAEVVQDGDLVWALGGDTTATDTASFLSLKGSPDAVLMFSDLGNACNAFHATVDSAIGNRPTDILRKGAISDIFPLRSRVTAPGSEEAAGPTVEEIALTILSVGAIATGAHILDLPKHRAARLRKNPKTRYPYEVYVSLAKALPRTHTLEISDLDGENVRLALDVIAAHAPRIGKAAIFDNEIFEDNFLFGTLKNKLPWNLAAGTYGLTHGTLPVERIPAGSPPISFKITDSRRNNTAMYQRDGHAKRLAKGSIVAIDQVAHHDSTRKPIKAVFATADAA